MTPRLYPAIIVLATALAGCAGLNTVTADVSSYGTWPAERKPGPYLFERLPSQEANPQEQAKLETAAGVALQQAGFTAVTDPQRAEFTVQISTRLIRAGTYYDDDPFRWGLWHGWGWRGSSGLGFSTGYSAPIYEREVALLLRDRQTGVPLYETHARNDNSGSDDVTVMQALFEAAMKDFPTPAINPRRVSVALPQH
jgi:hypothetical protein